MNVQQSAPIFVFLSPIEAGKDAFVPQQDGPFLAILGTAGTEDGLLATADGVRSGEGWATEGADGVYQGYGAPSDEGHDPEGHSHLHAVLSMAGADSLESFMLGHTPDRVAHAFGQTTVDALCSMVHDEDEDTTDSIAQMQPTPEDIFGEGGIARTRDALFWTHSTVEGARPTVETALYIDMFVGASLSPELESRLAQAMAIAGVSLPPGLSLQDALDTFYVGCVGPAHTAHGLLALRTRLVEDAGLFAQAMASVDGESRPLVPVLL